jgi:hypothetical protein
MWGILSAVQLIICFPSRQLLESPNTQRLSFYMDIKLGPSHLSFYERSSGENICTSETGRWRWSRMEKEGGKEILKVYSSPYIYSYDFRLTVFGFWIDGRIYWALWYSAWLHCTKHCYPPIVSTITPWLPLLGSGFQLRTFPSSGLPNCPRPQLSASHSNNWAPAVL